MLMLTGLLVESPEKKQQNHRKLKPRNSKHNASTSSAPENKDITCNIYRWEKD